MTPEEHVKALQEFLKGIEDKIASKQVELADISNEVLKAVQEKEDARANLFQFAKICKQETDKLEESRVVLLKEVNRLKDENAGLVNRKGELQVANAQLEANNREYQLYETKAWQALNTKDAELQEREKKIVEKESLRPTSKSFLPPVQ